MVYQLAIPRLSIVLKFFKGGGEECFQGNNFYDINITTDLVMKNI
jgi:hypothetical protein